jgi:cobalt-zinc-cadmium efflux system outer membrane protein
MRCVFTALAVLLLVPCLPARGDGILDGPALTLDAAFERTLAAHPDLRGFEPRRAALDAERERAGQQPVRRVTAELENAPGTGPDHGFGVAELTLSLAGVLERGGKREARIALAQGRIDALANEQAARRLDVLAETARRYLTLVAANRQKGIALNDIAQRERAVAAARVRLRAGASPESVVLTAQAALARAQLDRDRASQRGESARRHLAALWGDMNPSFAATDADITALPLIDDVDVLDDIVANTPDLQQFADERRVREARLQLARTEATPDLDWSVGVRRLEADDDVALVGSISLPLGGRTRAQPGLRAAAAEIATLEIEREAKSVTLLSTLIEAHGRYRVARLEVQRYRDDILPMLAQAESAAERAYRAGAISYLEWAQVQAESTAARRQQLDAALDGRRALIELQRLTAMPFVADATPAVAGGKP